MQSLASMQALRQETPAVWFPSSHRLRHQYYKAQVKLQVWSEQHNPAALASQTDQTLCFPGSGFTTTLALHQTAARSLSSRPYAHLFNSGWP
ncbi:hypothetical protein E2C01_027287 [Portunus trituberculatus]|uniref:Uncharacterized protein n=1 Tax=Portunus trituberculatus TaxID=210409 RepID=A0A5B7EKR3_PORTR|nr:hypothetical protein [Portunus trituberculatus]